MNKIENKMAFRQRAKETLNKRKPYRFADSAKVNARLEKILDAYAYESILFYLPMEHEIDVSSLLKSRRKKEKVYVPFMLGDSFKMVAYRLPLRQGAYNIKEPKNSVKTIKKVDIIIVPILGIDKTFRRIGFGKGMYDRFYERLTSKPLVIFLQTSLCHTSSVITQSHDIKADYIVTPKKLIKIKRGPLKSSLQS